MKQALVNGKLVAAAPDAPATATCPHCAGIVKLRNRQDTCFWRHVHLPRGGCPPSARNDEVEHRVRQVGDFIIELHLDAPDGPHLKLRRESMEKAKDLSGLRIELGEVHSLATALLDAAAELAAAGAVRHE